MKSRGVISSLWPHPSDSSLSPSPHMHSLLLLHSGYLTPSVAFGNTDIIKNLEDTGKFKVELVES